MDWRIKGVVQKVLSEAPGGVWLNSRLQRLVGSLRCFDKCIDAKVEDDWLVIVSHLHHLGVGLQGLDVVEIGSGWYPTLPLCFSLIGVRSCKTLDIRRHMVADLSFRMLLRLERHLAAIAEAGRAPLSDVEKAYRELRCARNLDELLSKARIEYVAPVDTSETGLPSCSAHMVYSNSVLEHIPKNVLPRLMRESRRILKPGGLVIHSVSCNDHYAAFDRTITYVNYLQYRESEWRFWNNQLNYQNRLRAPDFLQLAEDAGLRVIFQKTAVRTGVVEKLPELRIAPEFGHYCFEHLSATSIDFVARAPVSL